MDSYLKNLIPSAGQDHVGWEDSPFLARLTGVYTPTTGNQSNLNLYSFIEQSFDPTTGIPYDLIGGRQTYPAAPSVPISTYAIEENNTSLAVPGSTPAGYSNPGPYVELRQWGTVAGVPVYEFSYPQPPAVAWVKATASTPSTTVNYGGTNITAFPAAITDWNGRSTGAAVWLADANQGNDLNGGAFFVGQVAQCRYVGKDASGTQIWAAYEETTQYTGAKLISGWVGSLNASVAMGHSPNPFSSPPFLFTPNMQIDGTAGNVVWAGSASGHSDSAILSLAGQPNPTLTLEATAGATYSPAYAVQFYGNSPMRGVTGNFTDGSLNIIQVAGGIIVSLMSGGGTSPYRQLLAENNW